MSEVRKTTRLAGLKERSIKPTFSFKKCLLITAGSVSLILGFIGIFLPVLPTTPFVILAALCFSYSSNKLYAFVLRSKYFGAYIRNYREKNGVPKRIKIQGIVSLWLIMIVSIILVKLIWVKLLLIAIAIGVTVHILSIKTMT